MFKNFKEAVAHKFQELIDNNEILFLTGVERDALWDMYLDSFPEGTNNIFRERREYDCNTCKQFIRPFGNVVGLDANHNLVSIWDVEVEGYYQEVADSMSAFVKSQPIVNLFVSKEAKLGTDSNVELREDGSTHTWTHFAFTLPKSWVDRSGDSVEKIQGDYRSLKEVFARGLETITVDAMETVLELIEQNSIYRGEEHKAAIDDFLRRKSAYLRLNPSIHDNVVWAETKKARTAGIRNNAIGTLLVNISEGMDLDRAVSAFEKIMAPANYKRPKAVVTKKMIEDARKKVDELGFGNSLGRRYAKVEDLSVRDVLFVNRESEKKMKDAFDELSDGVKTNPKKFSKTEEVSIDDFIQNILPNSESVELLLENKHVNNFFSLIAPQDIDAPSLFKWDNGFSWAYQNDMTDTIKERVKTAGGNVSGILRCSLAWFNYDDLDIHVIEPNGNKIYYSDKTSMTSGQLDVDMNAGGQKARDAVENIVWTNESRMLEGKYKVIVHNYAKREYDDEGFEVEIECMGELLEFGYPESVRNGEQVNVAEFEYSKRNGIKLLKGLKSKTASKEVFGVQTNQFVKVNMITTSPNYWGDNKVGNKHYFLMLEGAKNDQTPRGFFNEFLNNELTPHRRVFEALSGKMRVEDSEEQVSGVGFSSTQPNEFVLKVKGKTERTVKVKL